MCIKSFGGARHTKTFEYVEFAVNTNSSVENIKAFVSEISYPLSGQNIAFAKQTFSHLRNIKLADDSKSDTPIDIDILIGSDYYWEFIEGKTIKRGNPGEPVAISSKLGFVINGEIPKKLNSTSVLSTHVLKADIEMNSTEKAFEKFWDIESLGIHDVDKNKETDHVIKNFEQTVKFNDNSKRYEVKFPVKESHDVLADNYNLSKSRLKDLANKFRKDQTLLNNYDEIIKDQEKAGVIEHVTTESIVGETHYLPHKPVVRGNKETTKVRMVYDASAKTEENISLKECLEAGPSLTPKLFEILLRFRAHDRSGKCRYRESVFAD